MENQRTKRNLKRVKLRWGRPRERIHVYVHPELVDRVVRESNDTGQSMSQIVDHALAKHFECQPA